MDLDDLLELEGGGGGSKAPSRPSRFAPKGSKFQPKPMPKPEPIDDGRRLVSVKKEKESHRSVQETAAKIKLEPSITPEVNGSGKLDALPKQEDRELNEVEPMDEDRNDNGDEEDCVVCEYDVYFSPPPLDDNTRLYVLQYPLRPCWRPYEFDQRCTEVRVKPNSSEVQIDLSIDDESENFDAGAPTALTMKKQTLSSSWTPSRTAGYAVGVLRGRKLYLNPVHAVVQLRPLMEYLNSMGLKKRSIPEVPAEAEETIAKALVGPSTKQKQQMDLEDTEPWVTLKYHGSCSNLSARYLQKMVEEASSPLQFSMNPHDYMNSLCPKAIINKMKPNGPSRRSLLSLPLEERLKMWLTEGPPVHRFSILKHLAPDDPVEDVLHVLKQWAHLVQGLWVPKTAIRHPNAQGFAPLARDYMLLLFSQNPIIKNAQIQALGSRKDVVKNILSELAVERLSCKDWKFREPTDLSFIKCYPDTVVEQEQLWKDREKRILDALFGGRSRSDARSTMTTGTACKPGTSMYSINSVVKASNETRRGMMSDETREALPKVLRKLFQTQKVCSFQAICQGIRDMAVSQSLLPKADARTSSSEYPEFNPLRNVIIDLLIGRGPNAKLKKSEIFEAAKIKLQKEPTNTEFQKVISELCVSKGGAWVLKSSNGVPK
ncbi:hypothetical protein Nepgr_025959 [Nepenthes gracilis]|uniref:DNA-directed RNA polymerase III subunit RPC5 n=1 Tax=Nepenthes gracilis TaxID=150966 RepID=A0AAD3T7P3_NEPGR|nr:hypothetical protein Nepgr_025959 [Nepenthes gracilis]